MYTTKQIFPERRVRLTVKVEFFAKSGMQYIELGSAMSENIRFEEKRTFNDALFNAFYRLAYKLNIFIGETYTEDIVERYFNKVTIKDYVFDYFEDRRYSYKRVNNRGKYEYVLKFDNKIERRFKPNRVKKDSLNRHENTFL